jgi:hypothetical protein
MRADRDKCLSLLAASASAVGMACALYYIAVAEWHLPRFVVRQDALTVFAFLAFTLISKIAVQRKRNKGPFEK